MPLVTPFTPLTLEKEVWLETQWVAVFRFNTVNADVVYYQTQPIFPSWTSRARSPSPALKSAGYRPQFQALIPFIPLTQNPLSSQSRTCSYMDSMFCAARRPEIRPLL